MVSPHNAFCKVQYWLKKKSYPFSICLFIHRAVRTGLSVERELVAHGIEWKGGLRVGRAGEGSPLEEFLIGQEAIFLSEMARRAKKRSLPPIYSGLCWCRGWQLNRQQGTVPDNFVKRESLKGQGCPRSTNVVLPSRRWSVSFQQMLLLCRTENAIKRAALTGLKVMFVPLESKGQGLGKEISHWPGRWLWIVDGLDLNFRG